MQYLKEEGMSCHIEDVHFDIMIANFHLGYAKVNTQCCHVLGHKSLFTEALDEAALQNCGHAHRTVVTLMGYSIK